MSHTNHENNKEEIEQWENKAKKLERELDENAAQVERETKERIAEQLREMGEEEACLKLHLCDLRNAPSTGKQIRDRAENLRKELMTTVTEMNNGEEDMEETMEEEEELEEEKAEEDVEAEPKTEEEKISLLQKKIEKATNMDRTLEERIKQFDRIDMDVSTKLEILESRRKVEALRVYFGGFMIFIGGMIITAGLLLTLSPGEFPYVYSMFDEFFNPMLIFVGIIMVLSGFFQQA
ncbi:MAG: hypothetical protein ACOC38_11545 [Promethearchaeia archaeon]